MASLNNLSVAGRVVLVSGASSGIGEATARLLAARGAKVVLGARRTDRIDAIVAEIKKAGGQAAGQKLDVTSLEDFEAFVRFAESTFGPVDVLINNAGIMPLAPLHALKVSEWTATIDVNIRGVLHGIAAVITKMRERKQGHIINVSSVAAHIVWPTGAVYCASKFAVAAISEGLRLENQDVRVTVVSPGVVESELAHTTTDENTKVALSKLREVALTPDAIARAIAYAIEQPADVAVNEIIVRPTAATI
ncbi:short-chain dehydrogenase [Capsaspora owczarzaki ATCC 30864]|uniref:Short-chain dehydrogenase n=1 Tax=Capsaspora owczarzaki (strain ATCC 30864) TaxID=595528 RepID=A0A0D2WXK4_CAPO3|nr:short-chain dehydrogenase [Capsaspora owczarzaki ATCC 30864]KJE97955.1 short-chain dehydrogenase [Capsaspora owczarzaki ATCC 30864]|eukprot:XP_004342621.1 short-chain dehydrogenase [Capsaspora owczarzaki ATCC 30864]